MYFPFCAKIVPKSLSSQGRKKHYYNRSIHLQINYRELCEVLMLGKLANLALCINFKKTFRDILLLATQDLMKQKTFFSRKKVCLYLAEKALKNWSLPNFTN